MESWIRKSKAEVRYFNTGIRLSKVKQLAFFPTTLCGVLVFDSLSRVASPPPPPASSSTHSHTQLCHIPSLTHTHKLNRQLSHTTLSHTISYTHTNLTHNFVTYHLQHTNFHIHKLNIQLCHIPSFNNFTYTNLTHNFTITSHTQT